MKKKIIALALLVAGLSSCNDEIMVKENTGYAEPGTAVIGLNVRTVKAPKSYAGEKTLAANEDEQKIESIAFFVKVGNNTSLQCYRSNQTLGTPTGFTEKLTEMEAGKYSAKFKISMPETSDVQFFALANYAENGIKPEEILNEIMLKSAVSVAITTKNPEKPLLMFSSVEVKGLKDGEAKDVTFDMSRLVARVDVVNKAFNTDASKGFRLTSAKVLNGKSQAALVPNSYDLIKNISVIADALEASKKVVFKDATGVDVVEATAIYQRLDTLYVYENLNGVEFGTDGSITTAPTTPDVSATAIQIDGTFNGTPVSQRIEFMKKAPATGALSAISIARNNLYTVQIIPSQDSTSVTYNISVADWSSAEGDTLTIKPSFVKPKLSTIAETALGGITKTTEKVYEISDPTALAGTLTFTASGNHDSKMEVKYIGLKDFKWMETEGAVKQGSLMGYYSSGLSREYTVDFSKADKSKTGAPFGLYLIISNASETAMCDTISIIYRPSLPEFGNLKPVLMKSDKFWAPINLGATEMPTSVSSAANTDITPTCGQLFQWGRKIGFAATNNATTCIGDTANVAVTGWPGQGDLASMETTSGWQGKFIIAGSTAAHGVNTQNNWLRINSTGDNPAGSGMQDAWYQTLWDSTAVMGSKKTTATKTLTDPCPDGWRVPTIGDWEAIGAGQTGVIKEWDATNKLMRITGGGTDKLILPAAGLRLNNVGSSFRQGSYGHYWASSVPSDGIGASSVFFNSLVLTSSSDSRANGCSVRCVQE